METKRCEHCPSLITGFPSRFKKGKKTFCSKKCHQAHRASKPKTSSFKDRCIQGRMKQLYGISCFLCDYSRYVEYAHIVPAKQGGTVHPDNIIPLCPNHHRLYDQDMLNSEELSILKPLIIKAEGSRFSKVEVA